MKNQLPQTQQKPSTVSLIDRSIEVQNESQLIIYERNLTILDSLKTPAIRSLKNDDNAKLLITAVTFLVMRASKMNAIYKEVENNVAVQLAIDLLEKFDYDSFEDIVLMFKYARYGKLKLNEYSKKKSFTETVLLDWFPAYMDIKAETRQDLRLKERENEVDIEIWPEHSKKAIRKIRTDLETDKKESKQNKNTGIMANAEELEKQLKEDVKLTDKSQIIQTIMKWRKDRRYSFLVPILKDELRRRAELKK